MPSSTLMKFNQFWTIKRRTLFSILDKRKIHWKTKNLWTNSILSKVLLELKDRKRLLRRMTRKLNTNRKSDNFWLKLRTRLEKDNWLISRTWMISLKLPKSNDYLISLLIFFINAKKIKWINFLWRLISI